MEDDLKQKPNSEPFHRSAEESGPARRLKKLTGKSSWFKGNTVAQGGAIDNNKGAVPSPSPNDVDSKTHPGESGVGQRNCQTLSQPGTREESQPISN